MMDKFITVHQNGEEILIKIDWVEEIRKGDQGKAEIYFAFQILGCAEQDFAITDETYDEIKQKIMEVHNGC